MEDVMYKTCISCRKSKPWTHFLYANDGEWVVQETGTAPEAKRPKMSLGETCVDCREDGAP